MKNTYTLHVITHFNASRKLRDYEGACADLHTHRFKVQANVMTPAPDHKGMVIDFYEIKQSLEKITGAWEQQFLNDLAPFDKLNPTNENLAKICFDLLSQSLKHPEATLQSLSIWENETAGVTYQQDEYR